MQDDKNNIGFCETDSKKDLSCPVALNVFILNVKQELFLVKAGHKYDAYAACFDERKGVAEVLEKSLKENLGLEKASLEFLSYAEEDVRKLFPKNEKQGIALNFVLKDFHGHDLEFKKEPAAAKWLKPEDWLKHKDLAPAARKAIIAGFDSKKDYEEKYKRALADYQNLLKRTAGEKQEFCKYANERMILEILPVYANLKISLEHIDEAALKNGWGEGVKYIVKQFTDILKDLGVEEIEALGKDFDPLKMEALEGDGTKVEKVAQAGYMYKGKVLVAAKVILD